MIFPTARISRSISPRIGDNGRLRMADLRQLQEFNPGLVGKIVDHFNLVVPGFYKAVSDGRVVADVRYGSVNIRLEALDARSPKE